jgi:uncharacterized protein (TIGR02246 family)
VTSEDTEKHLQALERQYWQALKDGDAETAVRLTDDPCIVTGAQGVARIDRKALAAMFNTANYELKDFTVHDMQVRMLSDDVAIVAYKVREDLDVDGQSVTLEAADASTWVRRNGQWVCALHTESIAGDPFGRDRRA